MGSLAKRAYLRLGRYALDRKNLFLLPYHHHFAGGMVAYLDHVGATDGRVEAQRCILAALGGEYAPVHIVEHHRVAVGAHVVHASIAIAVARSGQAL